MNPIVKNVCISHQGLTIIYTGKTNLTGKNNLNDSTESLKQAIKFLVKI